MGAKHAYYGVVMKVEDHPIFGDWMIHVLCEDGTINRICADTTIFNPFKIKRGMVVIYTKSYYWNLYYADTDIQKYEFSNIKIIEDILMYGDEPLSKEDSDKLKGDRKAMKLLDNLLQLKLSDRVIWFAYFVHRVEWRKPAIITTDKNGEILPEFYFLRPHRKLVNKSVAISEI